MNEAFAIADELFHQAALVAFVEASQAAGDWPHPDDVKYRAYALYERELANSERNRRPSSSIDDGQTLDLACGLGEAEP